MRTPAHPDPGGHGKVLPLDDRRGEHRRERDRRRAEPVPEPAAGGISMTVRAGVAVVTCDGRLGTDSTRATNRVLVAAIRLRPRSIVVDLSRATIDEESVPVLRLMHQVTARHGIRLSLAALSPRGLEVLRRAEIEALYDIHSTLALAVRAATARAHRSLPRREAGR